MLYRIEKASSTKILQTVLRMQLKIIGFCCHRDGRGIFEDKTNLISKFGDIWGEWLFDRIWDNNEQTKQTEFGKLVFQLISKLDWVQNAVQSETIRQKILEAFVNDVRFERYITKKGSNFQFKYPLLKAEVGEEIFDTLKELNNKFYSTLFNSGFPTKNASIKYTRKDFVKDFWEKNKINVCPACDGSKPESSKDGTTLSENDHFLPKAEFPFLAIHSSNLIPNCKYCNQSFKGDKVIVDLNNADVLSTSFFPFEYPVEEHIEINYIRKNRFEVEVSLSPIDPNDEIRITSLNRVYQLNHRWTKQMPGIINLFLDNARGFFRGQKRITGSNFNDLINNNTLEEVIKYAINDKKKNKQKDRYFLVTNSYLNFALGEASEKDSLTEELLRELV